MKYLIYRRIPPLYSTTLGEIIGELNYHWKIRVLLTNDYLFKHGGDQIIAKEVAELQDEVDWENIYNEILH